MVYNPALDRQGLIPLCGLRRPLPLSSTGHALLAASAQKGAAQEGGCTLKAPAWELPVSQTAEAKDTATQMGAPLSAGAPEEQSHQALQQMTPETQENYGP